MNYPAKHLSGEDMIRLQRVLMPLISVVIAFTPLPSCLELLALHDSGILHRVDVGPESRVEPQKTGGVIYHFTDTAGIRRQKRYPTYVDCVGQPHLTIDQFPFRSLVQDGTVIPARLRFRSKPENIGLDSAEGGEVSLENDHAYLKVPGVAIDDSFRVVDMGGNANPRIFLMAVPYIGGYNPDYSGLDFCAEASRKIVGSMQG